MAEAKCEHFAPLPHDTIEVRPAISPETPIFDGGLGGENATLPIVGQCNATGEQATLVSNIGFHRWCTAHDHRNCPRISKSTPKFTTPSTPPDSQS